jgi:hypothetical protein
MKMFKTGLMLCGLTAVFIFLSSAAQGELIGYWPLNETTGITATNLAPGGTIGILTNGPSWLNDNERGNFISFDGSNDHVLAGTIPVLGITSNFTWSFWANKAGPQQRRCTG